MRHAIAGKKLNRDSNHRKDMLKTMLSQLILKGKLTTTETKAKVVSQAAEHLLNKAKEGTVHIQRQLIVELGSNETAKKAIDTMKTDLKEKTGGFIKSIRLGRRLGDNTMMIRLELPTVETKTVEKEAVKETKKTEKPVRKTSRAKTAKKE